jgi:hypothetical protein
MGRYQRDRWEGRSEKELMIAYATVLSEQVAGALVRLPLKLPIESGEALVLRREWGDHPRTAALVDLLKARLAPYAERYPELTILP